MFKPITLLLVFLFFASCSNSEVVALPDAPDTTDTTDSIVSIKKGKIPKDLNVNGTLRDYIIHIPESYTGYEAYPLLLVFHGFGGNMESSYNNSKFYELAESENFITVHPNGISAKWDAISVTNNIDVNFVKELITTISSEYKIDSKRIYSAGMSNGGYFSFLLACELNDKIAGIGSVTGLMFQNVLNNCTPAKSVPIIQIHGTDDGLVNYDNVETVINFWIDYNNTDTTPIVEDIPNTNTTDGSTVERFTYKNGDNNTEIQHLKITNGRHEWPGYEGNMDINASEEVWNFLKRFDINGKI